MLRAWACCVMTRWARLSASVVARVQRSVRASQGLRADQVTPAKICHGLGVAGSVWSLEASEETELFISDDNHILTWFFRVEVRPLLFSRLFLLKLGCVG